MLLIYLLNFWLGQILPPSNMMLETILANNRPNVPTIPVVTQTAEVKTIGNNHPDADDPAIYVDRQNPSQSVVIGTYKQGGLRVYDLAGNEVQSISPNKIRYNNVDITYGVTYQSQLAGETATVDLAIASDRRNDTIAIWQINPQNNNQVEFASPPLVDVTSIDIPKTIFGIDDGEATAYGLTTYNSPIDGKTYVFVSQSDGNKIAQLELQPRIGAADEFTVGAKIVRTIEIPVPKEINKEKAFVEGMVVDRDTGILYLAMEQFGILKLDAEPNSKPDLTVVALTKAFEPKSSLVSDVEGLVLDYGDNGQGYLIASSQGDNTFAVYQRAGENSYLGSFKIKGVGATDGLDLTNIPLGEQYPAGLLVVQNGAQAKPDFKYVNLAKVRQAIRDFQ